MCCLNKHSISSWCEATVLPGIYSFLAETFTDFINRNNPSRLESVLISLSPATKFPLNTSGRGKELLQIKS